MLHQRNSDDCAQPAAKTRQEEAGKGKEKCLAHANTEEGGEKALTYLQIV